MALTTLLSLLVMGCALVLLFRGTDRSDRGGQYLAVLALALGAIAAAVEAGWLPVPPAWRPRLLAAAGTVVVGFLLLVRLRDRAFAFLLVFAAALDLLVAADVVKALHG